MYRKVNQLYMHIYPFFFFFFKDSFPIQVITEYCNESRVEFSGLYSRFLSKPRYCLVVFTTIAYSISFVQCDGITTVKICGIPVGIKIYICPMFWGSRLGRIKSCVRFSWDILHDFGKTGRNKPIYLAMNYQFISSSCGKKCPWPLYRSYQPAWNNNST